MPKLTQSEEQNPPVVTDAPAEESWEKTVQRRAKERADALMAASLAATSADAVAPDPVDSLIEETK